MGQGFYEHAHLLKDGAVLVYVRPGAKKPNYQARLKVPGVTGYIIKSLKTRDLSTAITRKTSSISSRPSNGLASM